MSPSFRRRSSIVFALCLTAAAIAQSPVQPGTHSTSATTPNEQRAIRAFEAARHSPLELNAFLTRMPKGGDLHMHLAGAVYAETLIKDAAADGLCVNPKTLTFFKPAATTRSFPPQPVCGEGNERADSAFKDQKFYDALPSIPSPCAALSPAQASVATTNSSPPSTASQVSTSPTLANGFTRSPTRAAAQNEQYLEIMQTPLYANVLELSSHIDCHPLPPTHP